MRKKHFILCEPGLCVTYKTRNHNHEYSVPLSILSSYFIQHHFFFCVTQKHHSPAKQTCVSISCSCRSISFVADPSILCSSIREKCSMLLIDSFSCRVRITSFQTEEHLRYSCSTPLTRVITNALTYK